MHLLTDEDMTSDSNHLLIRDMQFYLYIFSFVFGLCQISCAENATDTYLKRYWDKAVELPRSQGSDLIVTVSTVYSGNRFIKGSNLNVLRNRFDRQAAIRVATFTKDFDRLGKLLTSSRRVLGKNKNFEPRWLFEVRVSGSKTALCALLVNQFFDHCEWIVHDKEGKTEIHQSTVPKGLKDWLTNTFGKGLGLSEKKDADRNSKEDRDDKG